jgi:hypothetical protein
MGGTGQHTNAPAKGPNQPAKPVPATAPIEEDDIEDGDVATPKRDRSGTDDEPL